LVFFLLQFSKNIWFSCSSSFLKTFGFLEEQINQMFLEGWRSRKIKLFRKLEEQENKFF
jgi:hypothetical protein